MSDVSNLLYAEGQAIQLEFARTSPTTGTLSWKIPSFAKAYNGFLITASLRETNPSNYPTDGVVYNASRDLAAPSDMIGNAQVVVAIYDDKTTSSATVTGLTPNIGYYFSGHLVSNVYSYSTTGTRSFPQSANSGAFAGDIDRGYGPPQNPRVGQPYYDEVQKLLFVWDGNAWQTTSSHTVITKDFDPVPGQTGLPTGYPKLGDFFYNTTQHMLKCWDGSKWNSAQSESGSPNWQKMDVGTDMTYSARASLIDILKKQLGYPVVCVELIDDHFNIAINNALQELRRRTDVAYTKQYFFMQMIPFQDVYYLNDPAIGTNKIVDVVKIHRLNLLGLANFAPDNIYAQQFLNQFYAPGVGYDLVSIHLIHSMSHVYSQLFAGEISYNWHEARRELRIYRKFSSPEKVLIECSCEKLEQELISDRWAQQWIQQWAKSELYYILANIRGKFTSLPGPGGGLQLNGDMMLNEAQRLQEDCLRQIQDFEVGQNGPDNFYLPFMIG